MLIKVYLINYLYCLKSKHWLPEYRPHVSSEVASVCRMLTQWWHRKIGVGFMVNLASWKDWDLPPLLHNDVSYAGDLVTIFPPYSAAQTWIYSNSFSSIERPKLRNGGEFQQRGQKNLANALQMCLWAVRGNTVLPSLERNRALHGESSANYEWKTLVTKYSWFWLSVWCSREEKGDNTGTHAHSFPPLEELLVCRITDVYISHPLSKNTVTYWPKEVDP